MIYINGHAMRPARVLDLVPEISLEEMHRSWKRQLGPVHLHRTLPIDRVRGAQLVDGYSRVTLVLSDGRKYGGNLCTADGRRA